MKNKYIDLIEQTFDFPQDEFMVVDGNLMFNDIDLMEIIEKYGTPLKITYLPKISQQIQRAKRLFKVAMAKADYQGDYHYSYCTKSKELNYSDGYKYAHDYPGHFVDMEFLPEALKGTVFYEPAPNKHENVLRAYLEACWPKYYGKG